ncbi:uncharacterized protein DNG_09932 [Cephalotrichum gorgonifer]|uniref:Uncharacterized protein n=1 Tax=Cephalotrichum gorgonifer TaxID=2041049 RepID=A0AAE8N8D2_9PEZI|nr:uncharacterized protein DNG_09932 [Cephalotrichum gorgonifer]
MDVDDEKEVEVVVTENAAPSDEGPPTPEPSPTRELKDETVVVAERPLTPDKRSPTPPTPVPSPEREKTPTTTAPPAPGYSAARELPVQDAEVPGLPRLNYNILDHKRKLFIVVSLLVLESSLLPIALFYGLWFGTTLRHGIIFAIITSFFGLVTGVEFGLRTLKLLLKSAVYRPLGAKRRHLDFTHWTLSFGFTIMTAVLVGASIPHEPLVRPLAIPVSLFLIQLGAQLLLSGIMNALGRPAPFRISSVAKGERFPPLVLTIVEDIVAVDGDAGWEYRKRLLARYEASPAFRKMVEKMNWFWGAGTLLNGIATMVVVWTVPQEVAYGVGWGSPLVFVGIWVMATVHWVRKCLRLEKRMWAEHH